MMWKNDHTMGGSVEVRVKKNFTSRRDLRWHELGHSTHWMNGMILWIHKRSLRRPLPLSLVTTLLGALRFSMIVETYAERIWSICRSWLWEPNVSDMLESPFDEFIAKSAGFTAGDGWLNVNSTTARKVGYESER